jgi:enoyl-CoA hydratase/carnithine racemase
MIRLRRHGVVAEVVLDRPEALNALSSAMLRELTEALHRLGENPRTQVVVLTSSNERAFCVGADLNERASFSDDQLVAQRPVLTGAFAALRALTVPTIAALSGFAVGGGYELALSCDLIVADDHSVVGLPEVARGLIPGGGGTQLLVRRVGYNAAAELVFTGRLVEIDEAERRALIDRRASGATAREVALELGATIAANSPLALASAKRAMRLGAGTTLELGLELEETAWRRTALSADRREGVAAFVEKRPPVWPSASHPVSDEVEGNA